MYKEALVIQAKVLGKMNYTYANSLSNLSTTYQKMGKLEEAEPLVLEVLEIDKEVWGENNPNYAFSLNNLAILYLKLKEYEAGESLYLESLSLLEKTLGKKHAYYTATLNNLATLYSKDNNFKKAELLYLEAIEIDKDKDIVYLRDMGNLASLYRRMGSHDEAEKLYLKVVRFYKEKNRTTSISYAVVLSNFALLYEETNRQDIALLLRKESLSLYKEVYGSQSVIYADALNKLVSNYIQTGADSLARIHIQNVLSISTNLDLGLIISNTWTDSLLSIDWQSSLHFENVLIALMNLDNLLAKSKEENVQKERLMIADLAIQLLQKNKNNYSHGKDKLRVLDKVNLWVLRSLELLKESNNVNQAFEVAEYSKSILLQEERQTERAYSFGDLPDSLVQKENRLEKQQSTLEAKLIEQRPEAEKDSLRKSVNAVNLSIKTFKKRIEKEYPSYAALKYEQKKVKTEAIQKVLDENTALIEYVLGDSVVYIFYVDQQETKLFTYYIQNELLNNKIEAFRNALSDYELLTQKPKWSYEQYTDLAHWFYLNLMAKALDKKRAKHLIIVSDGALGHLPFETFLIEPAPKLDQDKKEKDLVIDYNNLHYLLKDYSISYNYSAQLFCENQGAGKKVNKPTILGMASNYKIGLDSNQLHLRLPINQRLRESLVPLPSAIEEVSLISKNYTGHFTFDAATNERFFKEEAQNYDIIHLAMHGLLNNEAPILSGLAFTENGDSVENNFLQAYEISKMQLNANLVVLSACETGYGRFEQGNGIASLARAFMYAGSSSLVVSLWAVSDYATAQIMESMYGYLSNGMDKASALQQAKLDYMQGVEGDLAHPVFWSPFIQIGDSEPIVLIQKTNYWVWGIGFLAFLVVGFGFWKKRKK
jgi:CHAT domain-containing protein/tetratricopeptide (TPR) repeat protein